jgi:hypothetical protein
MSPLEALQQVLQDLHQLVALLPDPNHTKIASQCLTALAGIQRDLMSQQQQQGQAPQAQLLQSLGGQQQ